LSLKKLKSEIYVAVPNTHNINNKQPMGYEAQLAVELQAFSNITYKPSKLGHTDIVFGL